VRRIVALALFVANCAFAQSNPVPDECKDSASSYCLAKLAQQRHASAEDDLNAAYKKLMTQITKEEGSDRLREVLGSSQEAWLNHRDRTCDFETLIVWGVEEGGRSLDCEARLTEERAKQLEEFYACLTQGINECP
jgi:uncharacterized protein YecT (DUF1311 family)